MCLQLKHQKLSVDSCTEEVLDLNKTLLTQLMKHSSREEAFVPSEKVEL